MTTSRSQNQARAPSWLIRLLPGGGVALVVGGWWLVHRAGWLPPSLVPSPGETWLRFMWLFSHEGRIGEDLAQSGLRMAFGFLPAVVLGVVLGMIFGTFSKLHAVFSFILDFARSTPITATYPFWIVFCGLGNLSKSAMVFAATCPTIILAATYGVQHSSPVRAEMARLFGASHWQTFLSVRFFDALPHIVVGLRTSLSYALIVSIVVELFMGTQRGLGQRVFEAYQSSLMPELFALVLLIGTIGYVLNWVFVQVERRVFHWAGK